MVTATLKRIVWLVVLLGMLFLWLSEDAHASAALMHYRLSSTSWGWKPTKIDACAYANQYYNSSPPGSVSGNDCYTGGGGLRGTITFSYYCADGQSPSGATCPDTPPTCPPAGTVVDGSVPGELTKGTVLINGCVYTVQSANNQCKVDGVESTCGSFVSSGATGTYGDAGSVNPTNPPPLICAAGTCPGTVNSEDVCLPCSAGKAEVTSKSSSVTTTGASAPVNNGTTVTKTSLDAATNVVTITTTTINGSGVTQAETVKTQDKVGFCQENPNAQICKTTSASGGSTCENAPSCSGDSVGCMIAYQAWRASCAGGSVDPDDPLVAHGTAGVNAEGGQVEGAGSSSVDLSGSISTDDWIGGSCLADKTVSIGSYGSFTIPLSDVCPYLDWMGNALVALSMMAAVRIVGVM